ncbi:capsular biosynthesis protein [Pontibacter diazotrophicus]|uniref:non-specific protein-tyrosine kinase n=1 Tax=Pontibacter diazotrophicus TaxID=1400979 RepID=A0A3D8LFA7_9BACT|nr:polysaccharide biosynthesis tyrosine autokinase [Pontibacter diazotrophicus]RDV16105.1 capsular biosynthesis protein [Pontibacter diazotrophicus]
MSETELEFSENESEPVNIKNLISKYLRYWYLFVLSIILFLGAAYLYVRYTTPLYSISSTLLVKDDKQGPTMALNDMGMFETTQGIEDEIIILKSKSLMERALSEMSLNATYYVEGRVKTIEVYGEELPLKLITSKLDSSAFGRSLTIHIKDNTTFELEDNHGSGTYKFGQEIERPYGTFTVTAPPRDSRSERTVIVMLHDIRKLASQYNNRLIVKPYDNSGRVLELSLVDPVPEKGIDIINKVTEVYGKEIIDDKRVLASNTIDFIDDRLLYLTDELSDVEKDVESYKRQNAVTDVAAAGGLYVANQDEYSKQLADLAIQIDVLESIESYLNNEENQYELVPSSLNINDPTLNSLIGNFNQLQLERQRILRTTRPNNPIVASVDEQLENLKGNIQENIQNIRQGLSITRESLQTRASASRSGIQQVPTMERELLEINRDQAIKTNVYLYLLHKREEAAISLAATVSNSRVIDPATASGPVHPQTQMVYLIALLAGIAVPFAGITVKNMLNDTVEQTRDVEQATATPVLGELNNSGTNETLVVTQDSRSPIAEQFRLIRSNLQFATAGKENKVILVTSSMSGEGKTFFSVNLASSLVLTGKRVVVVGFDLRRPALTERLGLPNNLGITNYLISDTMPVEEILQPMPDLPGLSIVGVGPVPPNPGEFIMLPEVGELINDLKARFDYVIIDTAPVGQVADALALTPYTDSCIYMVRYNYTSKSQLAIVDDLYKSKKVKHPMIVLNDAKKENGSYGYGYGYGYGYMEEKKPSWRKKMAKMSLW